MNIPLDDPKYKISHKNEDGKEKTLIEHIDEIKKISWNILKKHYIVNENNLSIISELAENHDRGKLYPGWNVNNDKNPPHSALSFYLYLLKNNIVNENANLRIPFLILKHHSILRKPQYTKMWINENIIKNLPEKNISLHSQDFQKLIKRLIDFTSNKDNYLENIVYSDLFGIFKTSDIFSAKFETDMDILKFKFDINIEYYKTLLKNYVESKNLSFDETKWMLWLELSNSKKDILLTAPTGWGKTFAAIVVALSQNPTPSHIIYVLPTITAINKMKKVLETIFTGIKIEENYYFADLESLKRYEKEKDFEFDPLTEIFILKSFIAPITITTIDQVILTLLMVGKFHLKRYHFRNSFFIFDEYHLYPPNGLILLIKFIKEYNEKFEYNIKTLFMSATEDPIYSNIIKSNLNVVEKSYIDYYKNTLRYKFELIEEDILSQKIIENILKYSLNNNVLVILNTVEKAIKLFLEIKKEGKLKNIILIHSRFIYKDRREKEEILENSLQNKGILIISTQVAEVSLDVSFDYLFTEVAPLPSLIQRFGRVNRYGKFTNTKNVFITYPYEIIEGDKKYPYEIDELKETWEILNKATGLENEYELFDIMKKNYQKEELYTDIKNREKLIENYIRNWVEGTNWFYSVDLKDDQLNNILNFREKSTTLVIPECMEKKVMEILEKKNKNKYTKIKEYFVPVPIWWVFYSDKDLDIFEKNIIFLGGSRFQYSKTLGYFDSERIKSELFSDDINLCKKDSFIY